MSDPLKEVGALWKKISKNNNPYYSGEVTLPDGSKVKVIAFDNDRKEKDTHPDIRIYLNEDKREGYSVEAPQQAAPAQHYQQPSPQTPPAQKEVVDYPETGPADPDDEISMEEVKEAFEDPDDIPFD